MSASCGPAMCIGWPLRGPDATRERHIGDGVAASSSWTSFRASAGCLNLSRVARQGKRRRKRSIHAALHCLGEVVARSNRLQVHARDAVCGTKNEAASSRGSSVGLDLVAMLFVCGPTTVRIRHGVTIAHEEHDEEGSTSSARVEDSRGPQKRMPGSKRVF